MVVLSTLHVDKYDSPKRMKNKEVQKIRKQAAGEASKHRIKDVQQYFRRVERRSKYQSVSQ